MTDYAPLISAFVLAGGASRRMGTNKAWLPVEGVPMIERVVAAAKSVAADVAVVTNSPEEYVRLGVPLFEDLRKTDGRGFGPLAGVETALTRATHERVLILGCDLPFLTADFLGLLASLSGQADCVVPRTETRKGTTSHGLCAVYSRKVLPVVTNLLDEGERRVDAVFERVEARFVGFEEFSSLRDADRFLVNLNTRVEYVANR